MITQYINDNFDGAENWFQEECSSVYNQQKVQEILSIKSYLNGNHAILARPDEVWNGKTLETKKIILQYAKLILSLESSYLLANPITITGKEQAVEILKNIYKQSNFNKINYDLMDKMCKYGHVYEYLYFVDGQVKSKIIAPEDSYPVYDDANEYIAFVEHWTNLNNVSFWVLYYPDRVEKWTDRDGGLHLLGTYRNISGLPIAYKNLNEEDNTRGYAELNDYISLLDSMEELISRSFDAIYKFSFNPIGVVAGQKLSIGKNQEGAIPKDILGMALQLDDGSTFDFKSGNLDYQSFVELWKILYQSLLNISCTPAVSMNSQDVSNLSEVSIKLLFSLADMKGLINEQFIREGFIERHKQIEKMVDGFVSNDVDVVFQYARPQNDKDIIENLKVLNDMGAISLETLQENNPFVHDIAEELKRLSAVNNTNN